LAVKETTMSESTHSHAHSHESTHSHEAPHSHEPTAAPNMEGGLVLTPVAAEKVVEIRSAEDIEESYSLRVKVMGGGCAGFQYDLFFDERAEGDIEFESHGVKVVCDQMSFMYLMGTEIDYVEGLQGAGFKFGNPNTTGSCGCGSSFSV
jgi:iron-sulfur cluster assembly accessory protein